MPCMPAGVKLESESLGTFFCLCPQKSSRPDWRRVPRAESLGFAKQQTGLRDENEACSRSKNGVRAAIKTSLKEKSWTGTSAGSTILAGTFTQSSAMLEGQPRGMSRIQRSPWSSGELHRKIKVTGFDSPYSPKDSKRVEIWSGLLFHTSFGLTWA